MKRPVSEGMCQLCQGKLTKNTIARHLQSCLAAHEPARGKEQKLFHLAIDGYGPYWLHVEMPGTATFAHLDAFLRHIWLEPFPVQARPLEAFGRQGRMGHG